MFAVIIDRVVGHHLQRAFEDDVKCQLVSARPRGHRVRTRRTVILGLRAEHPARGEVHGADGIADERQVIAVVGFAAAALLHAEHRLVGQQVRIGAEKTLGCIGAVPVDEDMMIGRTLGHTLVIVDHPLVATIHEVDLHARDAPLFERREKAFHVLLDGEPCQPQHDLHVALLAVGDQAGQVEVGIGTEYVGRRCRPAFVHDNIGNAVFGCEVDVVTIGLRIAPGTEIDPRQAHAIPPVPAHQSGLHPLPVGIGSGSGQQPHQFVFDQVGILLGHDGKAPRESARPLRPGNIGFFGEHLQAAVAIGAVLLRHAREKRFETAPSVAPDEHAGVVPYIGLSQQELLAPRHPDQHGQVAHLVRRGIPGHRHTGVGLLVHRTETVHLGEPRLASGGQSQPALFAEHLDLAGQRGDEAVGHTVVEKAELHRVVAGEPELHGIIAVPDDGILGRVAAFEHLVGRGAFHAAQTGSLAQRTVCQGQRQRTGIEDFVRTAPDGITDLVSHLDFHAEVSAGRRRTDGLGRNGTAHSQCAEQCQKSFLHNIII